MKGLAAEQTFPNPKQTTSPYTLTLPAEDKPAKLICDLQSMGHYEEKNIQLHVNMDDLQAHQTIVYEMVLDS